MRRLLFCLATFFVSVSAVRAVTSPKFAAREDFTRLFTELTIIADVNNDGNPDLVAALGGTLTILLGDGKGNFQFAPDQNLPAADVFQMVAIDLNGDGNVDLIGVGDSGTNGNEGGIAVSLGNGDGTFQPSAFYVVESTRPGVGGMAAGDFNGDGKVDLVVPADTGLWLLSGNGDGTFQQPVIVAPQESGSTGAAAADFNGDGKLDLVVTLGAAGDFGLGAGFRVYFGNGDGTFQAPVVFSQPQRAAHVVVGPLRRGGPSDIVMADDASSDAWIFLNDGKGNFSKPHYANLPGDSGLALGDMDNDGYTDLISSLGYVAYGQAGGYFGTTVLYPVLAPGVSQFTVAIGDLLNNGKLDIVTDSNYGISVVFNEGKRNFEEGIWTPVAGGGTCGASGDFNGDGRPDLAVSNSSGISILLATSTTAHPLNVGVTLPLVSAGCPVVGDVNGDGILDLVVPSPSGTVTFLGKGDGTFAQASVTLTLTEGSVVLGDFNRDGKLDFATAANLLAYGNGDGTFQTPVTIVSSPPAGGFSNIAVGDLNNDGWPDLALTNSAIDGLGFNVYSMLNNRHGGFTYVNAGWGAETVQVVLADVNGDGFLDMVLEGIGGSGAGVYFGNGTGQFTLGPSLFGPSPGGGANVVADFNGDGILDVSVFGANSVSIYPGLGSGTFGPAVSYGAGAAPAWIIPLSLLRPGKPGFADLAFPDTSGGVTVIYNVTK